MAFDRGHQRGFLAADKRAGAEAEVDVEVKAGAEDVLAEEAVFPGLLDGDLEAVDGNRVFGADVDVALGRADGVAGDGHCLQHDVGVALEDRTVHERAGVAFVGVAADILLVGLIDRREAPLPPGREAGAAAAAQPRGEDLVDDLLGGHFG